MTSGPPRYALATAVCLMVLAGCGGKDGNTTTPTDLPTLIGEVERCLTDAGLDVRGGPSDRAADDDDAPDGELVTTDATFIAFYASEARAEALAEELRARSEELGGTTTRHGTITVLYTKVPKIGTSGEPDERIEGCVA